MKITIIVLLLHCMTYLVMSEEVETRDLEDSEDLERRHRKRKKGQNNNPCRGYGGRGKTLDLFGLHDTTYISAPVMNYFFGCGVAALPVPVAAPIAAPIAPIQPFPYPINIGVSQSQSHGQHGHGVGHHGGHHGGHGGGHGGLFGGPGGIGHHGGYGGGLGGPANYGTFGQGYGGNFGGPGNFGGYNNGYNQQPYLQDYSQSQYQRPNRPLQNVVSAAASGFGNALADYITTRPRKTYKQINKQVNQILKPLYKLF